MTRLGTAILISLGAVALSLCVVPWSRWAVVLVIAICIWTGFRRSGAFNFHWIDAITAALTGIYIWFATRPGLWEWMNWQPSRRDFFFIWGARARLFLDHHGIDFHYLQHAPNDLAHPDYPWLWPLTIDWTAILFGWNPRLAGVIGAVFGVALLLIVRELFADELGNRQAALATLSCIGIALPLTAGFAEAPYIAYSASGILLLRRRSSPAAGLILGFAALTKNEGLALIVAVAVALVLVGRSLRPLWPAAALAGAWIVVRAWLGIPTDLFAGDVFGRLVIHITYPAALAQGFTGSTMDQPWFFLALAIALLVAVRDLRKERFMILVAAMQVAFFVAAYLLSPLDVAGHVVSSWGRLQAQLAIPLLFAALAAGRASGAAADLPR